MKMDQNQIFKQMLDFNKATFDNSFNAMVMVLEQTEKMINAMMDQATWLPEEGKRPFRIGLMPVKKVRRISERPWMRTSRKSTNFLHPRKNRPLVCKGGGIPSLLPLRLPARRFPSAAKKEMNHYLNFHSRFWKKSFPLSSTRMKAGKSLTVISKMASMPSSGYSSTFMWVMHSFPRRAAGPPMDPR